MKSVLSAALLLVAYANFSLAQQPLDSDVAKANDPLADANAINFQNYYAPSLRDGPAGAANTLNLRGVKVTGRQIIRATLPVATTPTSSDYASGLGDLNIFDAFLIGSKTRSTKVGIGPLLVVPTATNSALGAGKWQAGAAMVIVHPTDIGMMAALATWQVNFAGDHDRRQTNLGTFQPIVNLQLGGGLYGRSSAIWVLDFEQSRYLIPLGAGIGKVVRIGDAVFNLFAEPQFSIYSKGPAQPTFQFYMGVNVQWFKP